MKTKRIVVGTIAFLTLSTVLMFAQMQMPASTPGTSKPAEASAALSRDREAGRPHLVSPNKTFSN